MIVEKVSYRTIPVPGRWSEQPDCLLPISERIYKNGRLLSHFNSSIAIFAWVIGGRFAFEIASLVELVECRGDGAVSEDRLIAEFATRFEVVVTDQLVDRDGRRRELSNALGEIVTKHGIHLQSGPVLAVLTV
jgi:hypothetical protein